MPLIDLHTGEDTTSPSPLSYLSHFPYADSAWNGEGFQWNRGGWFLPAKVANQNVKMANTSTPLVVVFTKQYVFLQYFSSRKIR